MQSAGKNRHPAIQRLPLNRRTVEALGRAGLGELAQGHLDLAGARRLGHWAGKNGTACFLFSLICAASRQTAATYLERIACRPGLKTLAIGDRPDISPEWQQLLPRGLAHYPLPGLHIALDPEAPGGERARLQMLVELLVVALQSDNAAASELRPLFDDQELRAEFPYHRYLDRLEKHLPATAEAGSPWRQPLSQLLRAPLLAHPDSLAGQLDYIRDHWRDWLEEELLDSLALGRAVAAEEAVPRTGGPGPVLRPTFGDHPGEEGPAAFSSDSNWMANCVLLAKSVYVWLHQLSCRHGQAIETLDAIPAEELERLARWGINALWLIGIWERSPASRKIKRLAGNPEAEASAYALRAYRVAADLGGEDALDRLEARCRHYGIRLATDVVPNHTGIDSDWLRQHPDWYVQADQPPYPGYRFSGPDLSDDPACSIRIEDGYWDHADAAVVFELTDQADGRRRYIYHGNDGTHMPWNDTAQLNFLLPEVRRAMSDLIVAVARRFRLIRFDAAMTLARKHFRRLWFPPAGGSAGVPSRSACWMSDADFDRAFPVEFWREVVDRIHAEAPDTLLIAEAFWLMESYFVRDLGMHRVYNSAFMNLLKREENGKYRGILKDILAYNPEILKRYVNFMNNPDEATAVAQFGKGDKYFGTAVLLATLPGLPMLGHGQVEGLEEKYGMEYRRAYWQEEPDPGFIAHHERIVFPLLRRRHLFSGVDNFVLYDFEAGSAVDENVYVFSNGPAADRHLVVYNNAPQATSGTVQQAVPRAAAGREAHPLPVRPFSDQFGIDSSAAPFYRFRDHCSGLEYLRPTTDLEQGLDLQLASYQVQVLHDFQAVADAAGEWRKLHAELQNLPVASLEEALLRLKYAPLWQAFQDLLDRSRLEVLAATLAAAPLVAPAEAAIAQLEDELDHLVAELHDHLENRPERSKFGSDLRQSLTRFAGRLAELENQAPLGKMLAGLWLGNGDKGGLGLPLLTWIVIEELARAAALGPQEGPHALLERFGFDRAWQARLQGATEDRDWAFVQLLFISGRQKPAPAGDPAAFAGLVSDARWQHLLGINAHAGQTWFNRERMTALCGLLALQAAWQATASPHSGQDRSGLRHLLGMFRQRLARAAATGYRLDKFLALE